MDSRKLKEKGKSQGLGLIKNTVLDLAQARRDTIKEKRRQEFLKQVKDYYHPEPKSEEELREIELAKRRDYLRRPRERHERGEI
jgi:hypothetical protein